MTDAADTCMRIHYRDDDGLLYHIPAWQNFIDYMDRSGAYDNVKDPSEAIAIAKAELKTYNAILTTAHSISAYGTSTVEFVTCEDKFRFMLVWG